VIGEEQPPMIESDEALLFIDFLSEKY